MDKDKKYVVVVGNIGTVLNTDDLAAAEKLYESYRKMSHKGIGLVGGEPVTLLENGDPIKEWLGADGE